MAVLAAALPLGGCEESTFCGFGVFDFLFCDPARDEPAQGPVSHNDPPVARFSAAPEPGDPLTIRFTNTSYDPDGLESGFLSLGQTEWDLDGVEGFEVRSFRRFSNGRYHDEVTKTYDAAGPRTVRIRVTDHENATTTQEQTIQVGGSTSQPGSGSAPSSPGLRAAGVRLPPHALFGRMSLNRFARADMRRRSRSISGVFVRGRLSASVLPVLSDTGQRLTRPPRALTRFLRSPVVAIVSGTTNAARTQQRLNVVGLATLRGRPRGRVCFTQRLTNRTGRLPVGTLRLLGGTGAGARLFGSGRVRGVLRSARLMVVGGTVRTRTGRSRGLPARCAGVLP